MYTDVALINSVCLFLPHTSVPVGLLTLGCELMLALIKLEAVCLVILKNLLDYFPGFIVAPSAYQEFGAFSHCKPDQ